MRLKETKRSDSSKSSASHLADVVSGIVTAHVVPLVIPRLKQFDRFNHHHDDYVVTTYNGEERVVLFPECEAHLVVLVVVRLTIPPVKPEQYFHPQPLSSTSTSDDKDGAAHMMETRIGWC